MTVSLRDCEWSMNCHPIDQVRQLAQSAANTSRHFPVMQYHPIDIPFSFRRTANQAPIRKRFTWLDDNPIQSFCRNFQIRNLIILHLHLDIFQLTKQWRSMFENDMFEFLL